MLGFALRSVLGRRRRAALTSVAVLVGVSTIVGALVFTDTIDAAFRQLFTARASGAEVVVTSRQDTGARTSAPASMPVNLLAQIRSLPGVAAAQGQISDVATIVGRDGRVIKTGGSPTVALSYLGPPFSGLTLVKGYAPSRPREVVLDEDTARRQGYRVGDVVPIVTDQPVEDFRISGIGRFGSESPGGASFAVFSPVTAADLFGKQNRTDLIYVAGAHGSSAPTLIREIQPLLTPELVARTASAQVDTELSRASSQLRLLTGSLLAFAVVAALVGGFAILNSFSITIATRTRELALLRALGATRRQVLLCVLAEAVSIGALASLAGALVGLALASTVRGVIEALGFDLPSAGLVVEPRTVVLGVGAGMLLAAAAGSIPALRAMRAAPLEALRDNDAPTRRRGLLGPARGSFVSLTRLAAWPLARGPRTIAQLARENAARNPGRSAAGATSLMLGIALILFVSVYAAGLRTSTSRIVERAVLGDFTVESQDGASPIAPAVARAVALAPNVLAASSLKAAPARLEGAGAVTAEAIEPTTIGQVYRFDWINGSDAILADLRPDDALVERDTASRAHIKIGDRIAVSTETGLQAPMTVRGIYRDPAVLHGFALSRTRFDQLFHQSRLQEVFVKLDPGADRSTALAAIREALGAFPGVVVRSQRQLAGEVAGRTGRILLLFYALLAMSVIMSLIGIAGTLGLSIHQRRREIGVLRAMGMTPKQVHALIRTEGVISALIGSFVGIVLGTLAAWVLTRTNGSGRMVFAVPWPQLGAALVLGIVSGILAAVPPAHAAAGLDLLAAIADE